MENYNVLEEIENLLAQGYSEEHAEEVAMLNNYNIPLEDLSNDGQVYLKKSHRRKNDGKQLSYHFL